MMLICINRAELNDFFIYLGVRVRIRKRQRNQRAGGNGLFTGLV